MSLSEKYRPTKFEDMWQWPDSHVLKAITNDIKKGKSSPRTMLVAPFGVGKTSLARIMGRRWCCQHKEEHLYEPCGECKACLSLDESWSGGWSDWGYCEFDCTRVTRDSVEVLQDSPWVT